MTSTERPLSLAAICEPRPEFTLPSMARCEIPTSLTSYRASQGITIPRLRRSSSSSAICTLTTSEFERRSPALHAKRQYGQRDATDEPTHVSRSSALSRSALGEEPPTTTAPAPAHPAARSPDTARVVRESGTKAAMLRCTVITVSKQLDVDARKLPPQRLLRSTNHLVPQRRTCVVVVVAFKLEHHLDRL